MKKITRRKLQPEQIPLGAKEAAIHLVAFYRAMNRIYNVDSMDMPVEVHGENYTITITKGEPQS